MFIQGGPRRLTRRFLFLFAALLLFAGPATRAVRAADELGRLTEIEAAVLARVNEERRGAGLAPLVNDERLGEVASDHAMDMIHRNYFDHVDPDGRTLADRIGKGYPHKTLETGENILRLIGHLRPDEQAKRMVAAWMNSPAHRKNILDPRFTRTGIGVWADYGRLLAAQVFVRLE